MAEVIRDCAKPSAQTESDKVLCAAEQSTETDFVTRDDVFCARLLIANGVRRLLATFHLALVVASCKSWTRGRSKSDKTNLEKT